MNQIKTFENVTVSANIDMAVEVEKRELEADLYEYTLAFSWDAEQARREDAQTLTVFQLPAVDAMYMWHPVCGTRRVFDGNWKLHHTSMLTVSAPVATLFNDADQNTYTFATDEVKKVTSLHLGLEDSVNVVQAQLSFGLAQFAGRNSHTIRVYVNPKREPYYEALDRVRQWWEDVLPGENMAVPDTARLPVYSSWYGYHQAITAQELEEESRLAARLGMHAIIVDDGWQTADAHGGYGYTGDWVVCEGKIPDMRAHVQRVHEAGLKYILWYSVPFMGYHAKNWERFAGKLIYQIKNLECGVLDPRYPEVREYLIGLYENAMREYDIDGLKLDFIDSFVRREDDTIRPGMDERCIQDAAERLMTDIRRRLQAIKPDVMIEFRQSYIGPAMRRFGNMFRVGDCASDVVSNRVGIADLRLISGNTACHSDMLSWSNDESVEDAALQILHCLFGVIQFSQIISSMPEDHRRMTAYWLDFAQKNRRILLESKFMPMEPHYLYPVIQAQDEREAIIGVYARNKVVHFPAALERVQLVNATKDARLSLRLDAPWEGVVTVRDVMGEAMETRRVRWEAGVTEIAVPCSGLLECVKA